ncbi:MAG: rod shape-determining protein RodA [Patescibacteria group bacterium]|nr:rod shape-determining protein RodA [Patescibacteria group bacterium]
MAGESLIPSTWRTDWIAFGCAFTLSVLGLLTMDSFEAQNPYFVRQIIWLCIAVGIFFLARRFDWRILRRTNIAVALYGLATALLILLFVLGHVSRGAQSWFSFGAFSFEPAELANLALIVVLAKYFSRRHVEIGNLRHIIVSGAYALILAIAVALQPNFGGAIIVVAIWFSMVLVSGLSRKHLLAVIAIGVLAFAGLWTFGFHAYQRERILAFIHPLASSQGVGYQAYQATIAVGSGELLGKGIGYGTQSTLRFLPEYQTDFMFAAFAEEWGFLGVVLLFILYGVLFFRLLAASSRGATNFETLFTLGVLFYLAAHFVLHVGINMGLLPVTGTTIPFMSYGGSHLVIEFLALGIVDGMRGYARAAHREELDKEFSGGYDR